MEFQYQYGEDVCETSCGSPYYPPEPKQCESVAITLKAINSESKSPVPHATVKISTKKMSNYEYITVEGTRHTDGDGVITVSGKLNATYRFDVLKEEGDHIFKATVEKTLDNSACTNDDCTECSCNLQVELEKEPTNTCTCQGKLTVLGTDSKPIAEACVSLTVDNFTNELKVEGRDDLSMITTNSSNI